MRDLGARERGERLAGKIDVVGEAGAAAEERVVFAAQRLAAAAETQALVSHNRGQGRDYSQSSATIEEFQT